MTLADKIVVLRDGQIEQVGTPRELYEHPKTLFVSEFIGSPKMNILSCSADNSTFTLEGICFNKMLKPYLRLGSRTYHHF